MSKWKPQIAVGARVRIRTRPTDMGIVVHYLNVTGEYRYCVHLDGMHQGDWVTCRSRDLIRVKKLPLTQYDDV